MRARQPPPWAARNLADQMERRKQLGVINARALELDAGQDAGQQLASAHTGGVDEDVEVSGVERSQDPLGTIEILAEPVKPNPPVDLAAKLVQPAAQPRIDRPLGISRAWAISPGDRS